jgi:hypothetical protein
MTTKEQEAVIKLTLLELLSSPKIKVLDFSIQNHFTELPSDDGWKNWKYFGRSTITINIFKDDPNSRVKKPCGKTKGKKRPAHPKFGY